MCLDTQTGGKRNALWIPSDYPQLAHNLSFIYPSTKLMSTPSPALPHATWCLFLVFWELWSLCVGCWPLPPQRRKYKNVHSKHLQALHCMTACTICVMQRHPIAYIHSPLYQCNSYCVVAAAQKLWYIISNMCSMLICVP